VNVAVSSNIGITRDNISSIESLLDRIAKICIRAAKSFFPHGISVAVCFDQVNITTVTIHYVCRTCDNIPAIGGLLYRATIFCLIRAAKSFFPYSKPLMEAISLQVIQMLVEDGMFT
jgi:hypothetical protein